MSDSEKSEITYKLSLRLSALLSYSATGYSPLTVFSHMKKIYDYRSSIVHGSHNISKKREIKLEENVSVPVVYLAKDYLREVLRVIISEPKYLNPSEIDTLLLVKS